MGVTLPLTAPILPVPAPPVPPSPTPDPGEATFRKYVADTTSPYAGRVWWLLATANGVPVHIDAIGTHLGLSRRAVPGLLGSIGRSRIARKLSVSWTWNKRTRELTFKGDAAMVLRVLQEAGITG
jgi:hypothetical protein